MRLLGINPPLCKLVADFLSNRSFQVRIGACLSDITWRTSVLSPKLYNVYTADISNNMVNIAIVTYTDDTAIVSYCRHPNIEAHRLQQATDVILENINRWNRWRISVTSAKYHQQDGKSFYQYFNCQFFLWNTIKYLSVNFVSRLTWNPICIKRFMKVFYLFIIRKSKLNLNNKLSLYNSWKSLMSRDPHLVYVDLLTVRDLARK